MAETKLQPGGVYRFADELPVHRLGFGSMRLAGKGAWGAPVDRGEAIAVLRRSIELGVTLIDTADSYGPQVAEQLIREALYPYGDDVVIATKAGFARTGPGEWVPLGRPEYLRQQVEMSLRSLDVERIDLFQLHRVDPEVPLADQVGELKQLQTEGKIRHIGLSEVDVAQIAEASEIARIVSVQNRYNLTDRRHETVLDYAEEHGIAFIPWHPIDTGKLAKPDSLLSGAAKELGVLPAQLALAWLLRHSPVMLPIPGTSSIAHLEENLAAAEIELADDEYEMLTALTDQTYLLERAAQVTS